MSRKTTLNNLLIFEEVFPFKIIDVYAEIDFCVFDPSLGILRTIKADSLFISRENLKIEGNKFFVNKRKVIKLIKDFLFLLNFFELENFSLEVVGIHPVSYDQKVGEFFKEEIKLKNIDETYVKKVNDFIKKVLLEANKKCLDEVILAVRSKAEKIVSYSTNKDINFRFLLSFGYMKDDVI